MSRIEATALLPEIDAYIIAKHGRPRALNPREVAIIRKQAQAQMRVIRRNWPVRTGASRAAWRFSINPSPGQVALVYHNSMEYASRVTKKGQTPVAKGGRPWYQVLLRAVWDANKPRLVRLLKAEIDRTEAGADPMRVPVTPRAQRARQVLRLTRAGAVREIM